MRFLIKKIKKNTLLSILIITLFSLVVYPGYEVFMGDQEVYLPQIFHVQNPSLFQNDLLIGFNQLKYTYFDEVINVFQNIFPIDLFINFFVLTFITRFIYFYAIYKLALYFSQDETYSFFSLLFFIPGFSVFGYPYSTVDLVLVPRFISLSLNLLFLAYFLNGKKVISLIPLLLALFIHPITSIPFICYLVLATFLSFKKINSRYLFLFLSSAVFLPLLVANYNKSSLFNLLMLNPIDSTWNNIILSRNPYYFISSWNYQLLIVLGTFILFLIILKETKKIFRDQTKRRYFYLLFFIPLYFLILYLVLFGLLKMHFVIQLQILRVLSLWKIFGFLFFSYFAYISIKKKPSNLKNNFLLLGLLGSFIFEKSFIFPLPSKGSLLLIFLPPFVYLSLKNKSQLTISIFLILFSFVLSRILSIRIALLAPLIIFLLIITFIIRYKIHLIYKHERLIKLIFIFILCLGIVIKSPTFKITPNYFEDKSFLETCNWIKTNTIKNAIFITEPFSKMSGPLRLSCYANLFVSRKDGSFAILFNRDYALEWNKRMELVNKLKTTDSFLPQILNQYAVNYIFSDTKLALAKPEIFNNGKYFIYRLK